MGRKSSYSRRRTAKPGKAKPRKTGKSLLELATSKLVRSEHDEQCDVIAGAALLQGRWPELALLYAIPNNSGYLRPVTRAKLMREGRKPGVPDLCLPVARGGFFGLYIELKRTKGGALSEHQKRWIDELVSEGYCALRCDGAEKALAVLDWYLRLPLTRPDRARCQLAGEHPPQ